MKTSTNKSNHLIDFKINIKIKLAGLWTATTLCYLYGDYFQLYIPGQVESLISGENALDSPVMLFIASVILAIPPIMIFLSLVLKPTLNRILNIAFGLLFTIMMVLIAINSFTPWYAFYLFLGIVEAILTFIIVWVAFKWPRENEQHPLQTTK
ncbi:DUF6326 family protein [Gelidibacter gilvus]|uniref:DUF4293 family protein n=1 Tax=Gelidibacter gilvus TaxID=59602 RepID=A0A4Q0XJJ6_9FLAO|nr:DUF6326 family protein [Gelidibacter gilvus]RXJ51323.1 hypothetical protein ESZ48_05475 [Gelidibacter gilvus]